MIPLRSWDGEEEMVFLCSVPLNPLRRGTQSLLQNPHRMHAAVEGVLPPNRSGRLLWRVERSGPNCELLVMSPDLPTLDHIVEQAGWPGSDLGAPRLADMAPVLGQIALGRQYGFRVTLNPTSTTRTPDRATGGQQRKLAAAKSVRVGHRTLAHQLDWFLGRTLGDDTTWGFSVGSSPADANVYIDRREHLQFTKSRGGPLLSLDVATFQGVLTVTDAELFRGSLLQGLGRAKAYGCGLLTLAPPRMSDVVEG